MLAKALGLRSAPLEQIAIDKWEPVAQQVPVWIETVHGSVSGYGVQGYILHDEGEALLIDTAYNAPAMIAWLESHRVRLTGICLTHGHADHAEGIQQLLARWQVPVYLGSDDLDLLHWRPSEDRLTAPIDGRVNPGRTSHRPLPHDTRSYAGRYLLSRRCRVAAGVFRRRHPLCRVDRTLQSPHPL